MFEVPTSKAGLEENRFQFKIGDETFDVPKLAYIDGFTVDQLAQAQTDLEEQAATYAVFGRPGTPVGDAVRSLDSEQLSALLEAYQAASGVSVGESAASTDS